MVWSLLLTTALAVTALLSSAAAADLGLAARYPGDVGIAADPAVIAVSDYEGEDWKRGWECSDWKCFTLTDDPTLVFSGRHSLLKTWPAGSEGATLSFDLPKGVDVLYHRMYVRFAADAANTRVFGISGVADGLPQWKALGSAGVRPTELPYFCATLVTDYDQPRKPLWYPYHIDQQGPWGDNWPIDADFPADRWFCLEMMVKLNAPGRADGELRLWVDGKPVYAKTDMRWRTDPTVRIGRAFDMVYRSKPFPHTSTYWVDNRVLATRYIGPMAPASEGAPHMSQPEPARPAITLFVDPKRRSAEDREEHMQYGLSVSAPWTDGGSVFLNFPEHLEYEAEGRSILRHWDSWEGGPSPWVISPDGRQAAYRVESPYEPGVVVEAFARVASGEETPPGTRGLALSLRLTNGSTRVLPAIRPLLCVQYRGLRGFPARAEHFAHTKIIVDGRPVALSDLPTADPATTFKGCVVKGSPQRDTRAEREGGLIEQDMDLALSLIESDDTSRSVVIWWTPGKSMISNAFIPCLHADPYFGALAPGESKTAEGLLLFLDGPVEPVIAYLRARDRTAF